MALSEQLHVRHRRLPWWLFPPSPLTAGVLGLIGTTGPDLRPDLGIGYGGVAVLYVAQTLGTVAGAFAIGVSNRRLLRPLPVAVIAACALLVATVGSFPLLVASMAVGGVAIYALNARAQGELGAVAGDDRARALSLFHVGGGAGAFLAPFAIAALLDAGVSWRAGFVLVAVALLAYAPWARRWGRAPAPGLTYRVGRLPPGAGWGIAVAALSLGIQNGVPLWLPQLLRDGFDVPVAASSAANGAYMAALFVTRLAVAAFLPRLDEGMVLGAGAVVVTLALVGLGVAPSAATVVLAGVAVGAAIGPMLALGMARAAVLAGDDRLASSVVMGSGGAAAIVMPAAVVALEPELGLQVAVAALALPAALMAAGVWRSGRHLPRHRVR